MEQSLWSANGRITRKTFWLRWLGAMVLNIVLGIVLGVIAGVAGMEGSALDGLSTLIGLPITVFVIIQSVKRMHDVGKSGWYQIVPIYNLILACSAGTTGPNEYGDDPLNPSDVLGHAATFE